MEKKGAIYRLIPLIATLAGCATGGVLAPGNAGFQPTQGSPGQPQPPSSNAAPPPPPQAVTESQTTTPAGYLNLTPMTDLYNSSAETTAKTSKVSYSDEYVRIKLTAFNGCVGLDHDPGCRQPQGVPVNRNAAATNNTDATLGYPTTGLFSRYFVQPQNSVTLSAKISAGQFVATIPMISLSHLGGRTGDAWSRTIYSQSEDFPWFLVKADGSDSVLSAQFTLNETKSIQFQGAVTGLNVAVSLARQLAPQGTLVTALTAGTAKTRAQALDNTISSLFAMTIAEQHATDLDLRQWPEDGGLQLDVNLPLESAINGNIAPIGSWMLALEDPRPSIFVDVRVNDQCLARIGATPNVSCSTTLDGAKKSVLSQVSAANVLSFTIIPLAPPNNALGTVGTYISQHDGFSTGLASIAAGLAPAKAPAPEPAAKNGGVASTSLAATQLCKDIREWTSSLGFSSLDQDIILWAVSTGLPGVPDASGKAMLTACNDQWLQLLPH